MATMAVCVNAVVGGAVSAVATARDERCVLYSSAVHCDHKYVQVSNGESVALAQLRGAAETSLSFGLSEALQLPSDAEAQHVTLQVQSAAGDEVATGGSKPKCKCKCGVAASVRVDFLDRTRPPSAVARGLQRIAAKLLDGAVVWTDRRSSVSWLNRRDGVKFSEVEWESTGSGCCKQLATISSSSRVELHFVGDEQPKGALEAVAFGQVDEYAEQIARELGGVEKYARSLLQTILQRLGPVQEVMETVKPSVGALVSGLPGIGKTALAQAICKCIGVKTIFLNAADIFQTYVGQSEKQLVAIFESAVLQAPCVLLIDGIEAIAASRRALADSQSALEIGVLGALLSSLEKIKASSHRVFVLSTTTRPGDVDAAVLSNGRLDQIVKIEPPSQTERLEILRILTRTWQSDKLEDGFLDQLSESTGGFVGADLLSLCQKALQYCLNEAATTKSEDSAIVCPSHFEQALAVTYPSVLQTHHVSQKQQQPASTSIQKQSETTSLDAFSGVFGIKDAIQTLRVAMIEPLEDCRRFLRFGTTPPKGVLLTGPPGSGKTHLAHAVAEEVRRRGLASFVSVQCSDLLTKIVGDTEKALRELFATARNAAPCVLFFDQIESIAPLRGFDTSTEQTFDRMLSMLLVEMDGFNTSQTKLQRSLASDEARMEFLKQHVVILASTTHKELLDPAILRPGRFDVHIHVDFPDEEARREIILQALEKVPVDYSGEPALDSCEALARLMAKRTTGLSAGDVSAILREAAMASMRDDLQATTVSIKYVLQALEEATEIPALRETKLSVQMDLELRFAAVKRGERRQMPDALVRELETNAAIFTQDWGVPNVNQHTGACARPFIKVSYSNCWRPMRGEQRRPTPHLGALAHDRNRYKDNPPDFYALGQQYPEFKQYLRNVDEAKCRASLAWDDPFAVRELTKTLLLHDFGLKWEIPINRLCPPLPNRLNYLHWIEDLLSQADCNGFAERHSATEEVVVTGIDVGTGANCIYALLGATMNKWKFVATEIDSESYKCAKENVARNHLEAMISVKRTHSNKLLMEPLQDEPPERKFHFVMCNPPFFDNMNEADTNPDASCMGSANEMVFPGGEVAFIGRMIEESVELQTRVLWFTSMIGRKSSLRKLLALLREKQVQSTRTTEFFQGRTKRWGIAWTFSADVMNDPSAKVLGKRKEAHRRQELSFRVPLQSPEVQSGCISIQDVAQRIHEFVETKEELKFSADEHEADKEEEIQTWVMSRLEQHHPIEKESADVATGVRCAGRVEIFASDDNGDGFKVRVVFEEGERAAFWTTVDMVQAATARSGRQWRRKRQRLNEQSGDKS